MRRFRIFLAVAATLAATSAACTALLDHADSQCSTDGDCAQFPGAVCRGSFCVAGDVAPLDGGGFDGCFAGTPQTNSDFVNACTSAQCIPFDNCATLGLCGPDAGFLPATTPPVSEAGAATTSDAGVIPVSCFDPVERPNVIYVTGSSNFPEFLQPLAPILASNNPPYTIVWQVSNSCTGVDAAFNTNAANRMISDSPGKATVYYDSSGNTVACSLGASVPVDVGESDIFASSCASKLGYTPDPVNGGAGSGVGEYVGPIQAMAYVVPGASSQRAISAEAASAVFGHGGAPTTTSSPLPWSDPTQYFVRSSSTGTNQILSRAMNVAPGGWWGVDKSTAANMDLQLKEVPSNLSEQTIGVLATDLADTDRGDLKVLAFQAAGQKCAFWPDSTPTATNKRNVRDGHYTPWGPLHFYTQLSGGAPTAAAGAFVLRFSQSRLDTALLQAIIKSNNIPQCAMQVTRQSEMSDIEPYAPPISCGCFFDQQTSGQTSCTPCTSAAQCPSAAPACNYGFCEAQ
jgi:hypothetical protein